ncbi:DUF2584 domain-containing protein [Candidatus Micrarchaeota archaeon]|jgi:hypothetical protein|nr:DUF2584 domain-containing protein [Candidatus Micrarchaeota archaeon]
MGFKTELNWILKLNKQQGLDETNLIENETYEFFKREHRIYPIDIPIELVNEDWTALGQVIILEYTIGGGHTNGKYKIIEIYPKEKQRQLQ